MRTGPPVCATVSSICQGRGSGQPRHLRRCLAGAAAFIVKEAKAALKACSITRWLVCRAFAPSRLGCAAIVLSVILSCVDFPLSVSVSVFAPYSSLSPRGHPSFKRKVFRTVCSFITLLLHSHSLGLSEEDRTWFSLLNKSIFITLSSAWCHQCKQSHTTSQRAPCCQHLPIKLNYSVLKIIFIHW